MNRIESFEVDHNKLNEGMYISRVDSDIVTYDLRFCKPNTARLLSNRSMHTIEHLFATYVRNSDESVKIIYFGPMGCRTGFYFIVRGLSNQKAVELTKKAIDFIIGFQGEIPGASAAECGNYQEHSLQEAAKDCKRMRSVLKNWTEKDLIYETGQVSL